MPAYSPNIQYGCASKTHFVFAHKLGKDATHTLYNINEVHIRWRADDTEGKLISAGGPLCVVYDSALLSNAAALTSAMRDDNMDASVQMGTDEMHAYGHVDIVFAALASPPIGSGGCLTIRQEIEAEYFLATSRCAGLGAFTGEEFVHFISLRRMLPPHVSATFRVCQSQPR